MVYSCKFSMMFSKNLLISLGNFELDSWHFGDTFYDNNRIMN